MNRVIDINADLGEGGDFDHELLSLVSSANISCGAHAGTEQDIRQAIQWAIENNVAIGAHPSYPDRENRGRRSLVIAPAELRSSLMQQLHWLTIMVKEAGGRLRHVKPHGALYNDAVHDYRLAELVADCVKEFDPSLTLIGLAGGSLLDAGVAAGLDVKAEAFVDRRYQADGALVPRSQPHALITDTQEALTQALGIVTGQPITTLDGSSLQIRADTLCIHGDTAHALEFARALSSGLSAQGVTAQCWSGKHSA